MHTVSTSSSAVTAFHDNWQCNDWFNYQLLTIHKTMTQSGLSVPKDFSAAYTVLFTVLNP